MQPVLYEARLVRLAAGLQAQPRLNCCEWASDAEPGLGDNRCDCRKVQETERNPVYPTPTRHIACDYKNEPGDDKQHHGDVEQEHEIRERLEHGRGWFV